MASTVELLRKQGYAASGVSEIARNGHAPMGSFYHHFPDGKEQLAAVALDAGAAEYASLIERALRAEGSLPEQLAKVALLTARALERSDFALGCPVATTALETITTSAVLRDRAARAFATWQEKIGVHCVEQGIPARDAEELAATVIALVEGAELLARVQRSARPLQVAAGAIRTLASAAIDDGHA